MPSADSTSLVRLDRDQLLMVMRARGWNVSKLAAIAEVPRKALRFVIFRRHGDGEVTVSVAQRLSEALGVNVEEITRRS